MFLALIRRSDLKTTGLELLAAWGMKTDQQSFLKMMHQLAVDERADHHFDACLTQLKRHLQKRLDSGAGASLYDDLNKEISQLVTVMHEAFPSVLALKVVLTQTLAFLTRLLRHKMKLKPYEANSLHSTLIDQLAVHSNALTYQSLKLVKYCSTIWLCTGALASQMHLAGLLKAAVDVQDVGNKAAAPPMQLALSVLLLVHIHALGKDYESQKLVDFSVKTARDVLPRDLYPGLFETEKWGKVRLFTLPLFRKAQFNQFERFAASVPFASFPLGLLFKESFPQAVQIADLDNEYRHSVDPLDTVNSESSISSQYSEMGVRPAVEVSEVRLEVGAAAIARHEEEQQQLIRRLAGKS